jgi:hypothetical protein
MLRVIAIASLLILAACSGDKKSATVTVPPAANTWTLQASPYPVVLMPLGSGGVQFDFPPQDGVHYLVQGRDVPMAGAITIEYEVEMSGGARLVGPPDPKNTCDWPAHFSLYVQRQGDQGTASYAVFRWFSTFQTITPGAHRIVVPLTTEHFSDVFAGRDAGAFEVALRAPQAVGLTFGAGCFAGHGLYAVGGVVRFYVRSFIVG